ncbi:hypothetical protein [endosymbiont GvMRE of Glomus versiforme]|uniref:hypothetical protein n=1 Tax=endosymbiont GvMRE of Glomus versiforme TaxID=2039283 RepID=UPI000ECF431A|nr:hypothetical protein [endosymbiont GvMRE of Glomus versiforme]RHZ37118.1 hypothetical protein GvMRE_I1g331 [endosymbiont GvMRE of Glomus versiforme]
MKSKITITRTIVKSWIEKNGKIIDAFPTKETEYTEKEIEQENIKILFDKEEEIEASFPENKIAYCYTCKEQKRIVSKMKHTKGGIGINGLDNLNFCLECSLLKAKELKRGDWDVKNPEVLDEIEETINYLEELRKQKAEEESRLSKIISTKVSQNNTK